MRKRNNQPDEEREKRMLQIEHAACWLAFWGLAAVIVLQNLVGRNVLENIAGESIVLLVVCGYILVSCLRKGLWDRSLRPGLRMNLIISLSGGGVMCVISLVRSHMLAVKTGTALLTAAVMLLVAFVLIFVGMMTASAVLGKRSTAEPEGQPGGTETDDLQ